MSDGSMTWTPEAYVKILEVDLGDLMDRYKEIRYKLATGDDTLSYSVGEFLTYAGKVQETAKLLHQSMHATNRSRS